MSCAPGHVKWIYNVFGECVVSTRDKVSFFFGMVSAAAFTIAELPQIILNCKTKNTEGVSVWFVFLLMIGNACNITGLIITGGLATQMIMAVLFMLADTFCFLQCVFYNHLHAKQESTGDYSILMSTAAISSFAVGAAAHVCQDGDPYKPPVLYGTLCGWLTALAYIGSRIPQIHRNCARGTCKGLSWTFFNCAFIGNIAYCLSIFIKSTQTHFLYVQLPWLSSSIGCFICDCLIIYQFCTDKEDDGEGLLK